MIEKYYIISVYYRSDELEILVPITFPRLDNNLKLLEHSHNVNYYFYMNRHDGDWATNRAHNEIIKFDVEILDKHNMIYKVDEEQMALMILTLT